MSTQDITQPIVVLGSYVQNFAATFGINSTPTNVNLTLVEPDSNAITSEDVSWGATGFNYSGAIPGNPVVVKVGSFDYVGLVQSWEKSNSSAGRKFSVNLVDPRVLFQGTYLALNGQGLPTGVQKPSNYFNIYDYYASPAAADQNKVGITFSKVRQFLEATGIMNAYNRRYKLRFSSGFLDGTGVNPSGIPPWYRVPATNTNIGQLLDQVSKDFSFDYYAILTSGNYNPTGISTIDVVNVPRSSFGQTTLSGFISGVVASGLTTDWKYGQELITDPTSSILFGPAQTYWPTINSSDIECVWGYTTNQTPITTSLGNTGTIPILLDHIKVSGRTVIASEITVTELYLQKVTGLNTYPPTISRVFVNVDYPGYNATEDILRAASFSFEAWKSILHQQNPTFAASIGIYQDQIFNVTGFDSFVNTISIPQARKININWRPNTGVIDNYYVEDLVEAVHKATKDVADNYYGKEFLIRVGSSQWLAEGSYNSTEVIPQLEFAPVQYAWSEPNISPPSGATANYPALQATSRAGFKDNDGRVTAFLGVPNFKSFVSADWPYPVDLSNADKSDFLIDQERVVFPVQVKVYEKVPSKAIVTLSRPIEGKPLPNTNGYINNFDGFIYSGNYTNPYQGQYYDFLRLKGFSQDQIVNWNLMNINDADKQLGLAPRRLGCILPQNPGVHGFAIPAESAIKNFAGFATPTGTVLTPINIIEDSTMAPWTYGGINNMITAGSGIIGRVNSTGYYAEFGQVRVAGYPMFNIGAPLGSNNLITNLSLDYGIDGFATNYSVKTYTLPGIKLTKLLQDKNPFVGSTSNFTQRGVEDLTKEFKELQEEVNRQRKEQEQSETLFRNERKNYTNTRQHNMLVSFNTKARKT